MGQLTVNELVDTIRKARGSPSMMIIGKRDYEAIYMDLTQQLPYEQCRKDYRWKIDAGKNRLVPYRRTA